MATSEYVDPRVKLIEAKGMLSFMDTDGDGQVIVNDASFELIGTSRLFG